MTRKKKGEKLPEYKLSEYKVLRETKLGGMSPELGKILKGPNKVSRMKRIMGQIGQAEKKKIGKAGTEERKIKESHDAIWRPIGAAPKKVKSYSKAHKAKQEAQKVLAMTTGNGGTGKARGHNLKRGQTDGDRGRKQASEERSKK